MFFASSQLLVRANYLERTLVDLLVPGELVVIAVFAFLVLIVAPVVLVAVLLVLVVPNHSPD
jgi:hypothetical protein